MKKIKFVNPLTTWAFWLGGLIGGALFRFILGKGTVINFIENCVGQACIYLGFSMNTLYGVIAGMSAGYILYILIKGGKR